MPKKSRATDAYLTHTVVTNRIMQLLPDDLPKGSIVEPGAGLGSFVMALEKKYPKKAETGKIIAIDNEPKFADVLKTETKAKVLCRDFLTWEPKNPAVLVVGNPPFSLCEQFILHSLDVTKELRGSVVFLLRAAFLETKKRMKINKYAPLKRVCILVNRPTFYREKEDGTWKYEGTDQTMYAVFQWDWSYEGPRVLEFIEDDWRKLIKESEQWKKENK